MTLLTLAACDAKEEAARIRDSAGVRIVENGPRATTPIAFTLAPTPISDIGGLQDNPEEEINSGMFAFPTAFLSNGTRVVSDKVRLRFYDASGRHIKAVGRSGKGPQEFTNIQDVCSSRDTVVALDNANSRVSILDRSGSFVREFVTEQSERLGCFDDGTILLGDSHGDGWRLTRWRLDGSVVKVIGIFSQSHLRNPYIYTGLSIAVHGSRLHIGDPSTSEVRSFDPEGRLVAIVRTADSPPRISAERAEAMLGNVGVSTSDGSRPSAGAPAKPPLPTAWPHYSAVTIDRGGRLRILDFTPTYRDTLVWSLFDERGVLLGKMAMPPKLSSADPWLMVFTDGGALIRSEDSNGAVHLREHRIVRR